MAKMIHTMIRVIDLERSINFYEKVFNLQKKRYLDFDDFALAYLGNDENDFELELTLNKDQEDPYTHGSGYGHIALCVDNLEAEHARIKDLGFEPRDIVEFSPGDELLAKFFFITDPDDYQIEVLQRHGNYT
ncbi:MAG: lactoylglutathione lyase [Gammaproteobacteria bacterium]|jgi:lactoylglutathione lyase|nr:MAG: lactoylglutathione lyase [Gammaproteobacteria bacterium]RKZ65007.1 MAG: lactoylglutathione lyase [Gammaproteobacteria bacterium]